jgi:hypothetical protein
MTKLASKSIVHVTQQVNFLLTRLDKALTDYSSIYLSENIILLSSRHPDSFQPHHLQKMLSYMNSTSSVSSRARMGQAIHTILKHQTLLVAFLDDRHVQTEGKILIEQTIGKIFSQKDTLKYSKWFLKCAIILITFWASRSYILVVNEWISCLLVGLSNSSDLGSEKSLISLLWILFPFIQSKDSADPILSTLCDKLCKFCFPNIVGGEISAKKMVKESNFEKFTSEKIVWILEKLVHSHISTRTKVFPNLLILSRPKF